MVLHRVVSCGVAAVVLALSGAGTAVAGPTPPTIEQLAKFPAMSDFRLSPDGKHLVALQGNGETQAIAVWDTDNLGKPPTVFGSANMKVTSVSFLKNDVLGVSLWQPYDMQLERSTKTFIGKFFLVGLDGRNWRDPLPAKHSESQMGDLENALSRPEVLDVLRNDPDNILVVDSFGPRAGDIFRINVHSGRAERVMRSDDKVGGYIVDLNGEIRARTRTGVDSTGAYVTTEIRDVGTNSWQEHRRTYAKTREVFQVVGFSKDPNVAYVLSSIGRDKQAVYEYNIAARKTGEIAFEHKFFDAAGVNMWPYKDEHFGEVIGFSYEGPREDDYLVSQRFIDLKKSIEDAVGIKKQPLKLIDPATGSTTTVSYPVDRYVEVPSFSKDLSKAVAWVGGPNDPGAFYLLHDKKLDLLSKQHPDLDPAILGSTTLVYYKARDGLDIPAFLTRPSEAVYGKGPWPTVILPHGGPWGRDHLDWDWSMWPQMLASRGMAVLQPQFRGSAGWGAKLWRAGDAEWGGKMQDDKDDGAKWLIAQSIAQPGHIAMFGFSYGGYAAFDAAVRPNGIYKCAIAGAGVSDIRKIWSDFYDNPEFRDAQEPTVRGTSPVDYADKITIPIMVYGGERDQTVPIEQSHWFVKKAKAAGKDVVFHQLADYAHGPAWTRAIFAQQLGYIDDYLKKGCGGGGL